LAKQQSRYKAKNQQKEEFRENAKLNNKESPATEQKLCKVYVCFVAGLFYLYIDCDINMTNIKNRKYEKMIQRLSLVFMVAAGGVIGSLPLLNGRDADAKAVRAENDLLKTTFSQDISQVCNVSTKERPWQYIVIHHSASVKGNATRFDTYHRKNRGWEHGLAYHFVIGNGTLSGDGEIEVGDRWKEQIHGAHTANMDCNKVGIGICLVGDFENGGIPTGNQFDTLVRLTRYLSRKFDIPLSNIILHSQVHQKGTACPGKNFPVDEFKTSLIQIASTEISPGRKS